MLATRDVATSVMCPWIRWVGGGCRESSPSGPRGAAVLSAGGARRLLPTSARGHAGSQRTAVRVACTPRPRRGCQQLPLVSIWEGAAVHGRDAQQPGRPTPSPWVPPWPLARSPGQGSSATHLWRAATWPWLYPDTLSLLLLWQACLLGVPTQRIGARPARCAAGCEPSSQRPLRMNRPSPSSHLWVGPTGHLSALWLCW